MTGRGAGETAGGSAIGGVLWVLGVTALALVLLQVFGALTDHLQTGASARARALGKIASAAVAQLLVVFLLRLHLERRGQRLLEHEFFGPGRLRAWVIVVALWALVVLPNFASAEAPPLLELSGFNLAGSLLAGPAAGTAEELLFRGALFAALARRGFGTLGQLLLCSAAFGLAHAGWSLLTGDVRLGAFAVAGTAVFGLLLGAVYLAAGRRILPAVALHVAINVVIEPWLVLAAINGEMGLVLDG